MEQSVQLRGEREAAPEILTDEAIAFVASLERQFGPARAELLAERAARQEAFDRGEEPRLVTSGEGWKVAATPEEIADRRVEITGPVDRKMMINALNSGAQVFMADFEDATSPTWANLVAGQANLVEAHRRTLRLETPEKSYRLGDRLARLFVRPRGWHLTEKHLSVDGRRVSASLFDFGLYLFHGARAALEAGSGPYLYLPKLQSASEARLWNDVFVFSQESLGIRSGTIKATVLIETLPAAFEMDPILYELREHSAGLNAGRWDYIFSTIKTFRNRPGFVLPDRAQVTMTVPFMRAYTDLLVATCHRRGAHAIGGMAAFVPNRRDPVATERALERVTEDKQREAGQGFDGTWVAHPDLVAVARDCLDRVLGDSPHQKHRLREEVAVTAADLLDFEVEGGRITEPGLRTNLRAGIYYLAAWLAGTGAVAIDNLMEDAATAEISRSQIWQWAHSLASLEGGRPIDRQLVSETAAEEMSRIPLDTTAAWRVFEEVALADQFTDFLTLPAYELID
jgi:malate synthase